MHEQSLESELTCACMHECTHTGGGCGVGMGLGVGFGSAFGAQYIVQRMNFKAKKSIDALKQGIALR